MRIVQAVGWYFPDSLGGTEVYVAGLSRRLQKAGHDVAVAAPAPGTGREYRYEHEGVPVYRYPTPARPTRDQCRGVTPARGADFFHRWLDQRRPDVVHFHTFVTGLGLAEVKRAKQGGARVICTTHSASLGFVCERGTMMRWGETPCDGICRPRKCAACVLHQRGIPKPAARLCAAIAAPVARVGQFVPGRCGTLLAMPHFVARNRRMQRELLETVDRFVLLTRQALEVVAANGGPRGKLALNRLGLSQPNVTRKPGPGTHPTRRPVRIGYLGRFDPIKGVHDLARAVAGLPREVPLCVEFRGPVRTERDRGVVRQLQAILRNEPRTTFAPAVAPDEVPRVLAAYDLLCCPSICLEGGPTVAIEAQAVGTPVIGTRLGGLAEIVADGRDGRLFEPGDWRGLAGVLKEVAADPAATVDRWRDGLPTPRTMDDIAADYLVLYSRMARYGNHRR